MEISENKLIDKIRQLEKKNPMVSRGIGDDGAVVRLPESSYVFVQDAMIEHVHFEFAFTDPYYVGKKAVYVNVSDVLSMGATPLYFLVTIGVPPHCSFKDIKKLYAGIMRAAAEFGAVMIGGDTSSSRNDFFIDISMVGLLAGERYTGREAAKVGDLIGVTGYLGESAYGLFLLKNNIPVKKNNRFVKRYTSPKPPYRAWKELMRQEIPNGMMDISDGLLLDLERMIAESRKGAKIFMERLPVPHAIIRQKKETLALSGGEDYQLLFTFPGEKQDAINTIIKKGIRISVIGEVTKGKNVVIYKKGEEMAIESTGYDHFKSHL